MTSFALIVEHDATIDLGGDPWPPPGDGWVLVRQSPNGASLWRRIYALRTNVPHTAARPRRTLGEDHALSRRRCTRNHQ